jgi:phytoene dehydrogenase-like protein
MDPGAIVIGAGHNGLICAAYLQRAGFATVLLEARESVGGCASTVDALGARVNICNCDHTVFRTTPVMDELDLARHGLAYLDVEPAQLHLGYDGSPAWAIFHDVERTLDSLRLTHPREVDGYRRYVRAAKPIAELVLAVANDPPTSRSVLSKVAARHGAGVATMLRWSRMTVADVMRSFFNSDAVMMPLITTGPAVWGLSPYTPGTGLGAIGYALKHVATVGRPVGGSGAVPSAVLASFLAAGGTVRCNSRVTAITCEGDAVRGVELADGSHLEAPLVVSACDPRETFVSWLRQPPAAAGELVERWRTAPVHEGYESKLDAVVSALPRYRQVDPIVMAALGIDDPLVPTSIVSPSMDDVARAHGLLPYGRIAERPMFFANLPSVLDPSMMVPGTDGGHVLSLEVLHTPYRLAGGWSGSREPERWLEVYGSLLEPGFLDSVRRWRVMTPVSYETEFFMPRGYATSFAGTPLTALLGKQPELTRYRTPVRGLWLTGAATFPGAGVWGASGRNAARAILATT